MSDVEEEGDPEEVHSEDLDDEEYDEEDEEIGEPPSASISRNYQKLPDDVVTLVGFSKILAKPRKQGGRWVSVKPQVLYSTAKNTKSFPAYQHVDGRWVININEGLDWWDNKEQRKAERAAEAQAAMGEEENEEVEA